MATAKLFAFSAVARYVVAGVVIGGVPLGIALVRQSSGAQASTPPVASERPVFVRVDVEITSPTPNAQVKIAGETHPLPFSGAVNGHHDEEDTIEITAPGHEGRTFKVVLDRPRRISFALPPGDGIVEASPEEVTQALLGEDELVITGPTKDAGNDASATTAPSGKPNLAATATASATGAPVGPSLTEPPPEGTSTNAVVQPTATATATATAPAVTAPTTSTGSATTASTATTTGGVPAPGTIDTKAVRATVHAHAAEVQTCYDRAHLESADLHGRMTVDASVSPNGQVQSARIASSDVKNARLEGCILGAFKSWRFPAPAGGVAGNVTYTFVFKD